MLDVSRTQLKWPMKNPIASDSPVPAYRQIADWLRGLLLSGEFQPDDTLPSVRQLAEEFGVNFNTVAQGYRLLAEEGWLDLRHGRKAAVLKRRTPKASRHTVKEFASSLRILVAFMRASGVPTDKLSAELQAVAKELKG